MKFTDLNKIPKHVGIILDGNGRWAQKRELNRSEGHIQGSENVVNITRACSNAGVAALSLYAFSTENWKRSVTEVSALMELIIKFIKEYIDELNDNNIKLTLMGEPSKIPFASRQAINYAQNKTKDNTGMVLNIGLNYGGRDSIIRSINQLLEDPLVRTISEDDINRVIETHELPQLDLVIRTGGEERLSNFMIWEAAYAEFYFTDILWPDFSEKDLYDAFYNYQQRDRRYGGVK